MWHHPERVLLNPNASVSPFIRDVLHKTPSAIHLICALVSRFIAADVKHPQGILELKTQCLNPSVACFPAQCHVLLGKVGELGHFKRKKERQTQRKKDQPEIRAPLALLRSPLMFSCERAAFLCFMSTGYLCNCVT